MIPNIHSIARLATVLTLLFSLNTIAQTTVWELDFESGYSNGDIVAQDHNPPSGADWTFEGGCTFQAVSTANPVSGAYSFRVRNCASRTWTSETIDISSYSSVNIAMNILEIDCEAGDRIETYYSLDGGSAVEFGDGNGDGNFGVATNSITDLSGSSLVITVVFTSDATNDKQKIDDVIVQSASAVLPIKLGFFRVLPLTDRSNHLQWQTLTEKDNDYFAIERSEDARTWQEVTRIPGAGNSDQPLEYEWVDHTDSDEDFYYRMKQVDYDGQFTYFDAAYVGGSSPSLEALKAYPNPTTQITRVEDPGGQVGNARLFSMTGEEVTHLVTIGRVGSTVTLDLDRLSPGIFYLRSAGITPIVKLP